MESELDLSNNQVNITVPNNNKANLKSIFVTNNFKNEFIFQNDNKKICQYCNKKFFSKFNKERHVNSCQFKIILNQKSNNNIISESTKNKIDNITNFEKNNSKENTNNLFIGFKRNSNTDLNNIQNENKKEKAFTQDNERNQKNDLGQKDYSIQKVNNKALIKEKICEFIISPNNKISKKNISGIIIDNFYTLLKNNEYLSISNFFMFKNLVLGHGKYGTVFFGIEFNNARPVAIKVSNGEIRINSLAVEIDIMTKLSKFKIFTKLYDQIRLEDQLFLMETLQGPDLSKLINFYGENFSILTVYKIGIEILRCLKLIHQIGYLYIDLKENNIAMLIKPVTYLKKTNKLTLIDYGFCEQFNKDYIKSPKIHGHASYASINSLKRNPVSRKDDLISFCYFFLNLYNGYLPWDDINNDNNRNEEIMKMKEKYSIEKLCGNANKEISFIYRDVKNLKFNEKPNYDNYIYLLENYIKINSGKSENEIIYDWENKIIEQIKYYGGIENYIKSDKKISELFEGYPDIFVKDFLERYIIEN